METRKQEIDELFRRLEKKGLVEQDEFTHWSMTDLPTSIRAIVYFCENEITGKPAIYQILTVDDIPLVLKSKLWTYEGNRCRLAVNTFYCRSRKSV
ncbi:hypothetical protein FACS189442_5630 [Spirochaetia bacterium]|nr:hypothetical protein FACS1894110_24470 [Spirochaetia bacterium]GHU56810.1 hypothetical protein FACS189442_5630 [Spirochaetia bacterium]